jgi:hypothetical protein
MDVAQLGRVVAVQQGLEVEAFCRPRVDVTLRLRQRWAELAGLAEKILRYVPAPNLAHAARLDNLGDDLRPGQAIGAHPEHRDQERALVRCLGRHSAQRRTDGGAGPSQRGPQP